MTITLDFLILLLGMCLYLLAANGKVQELGRIMFAFALLAILLGADRVLALFRG